EYADALASENVVDPRFRRVAQLYPVRCAGCWPLMATLRYIPRIAYGRSARQDGIRLRRFPRIEVTRDDERHSVWQFCNSGCENPGTLDTRCLSAMIEVRVEEIELSPGLDLFETAPRHDTRDGSIP